MKKIKHYFQVYQQFVATSSAVNTSFRTSFALLILMDLFFYLTALSSVSFIYDHVSHIGPWNKNQLMFFIAFMLTIDNLHMMLVSESFWEFSRHLRTGDLDYIILKPLGTIFSIFFRFFRPSSLVSFPIVVILLIKYGISAGLHFIDWIYLPFLLALGFSLLIVLEFILSASMFWITEGLGINFLRMQFQSLARWPDFVYGELPRRLFTVALPILLIGSAPVHFLYDKSLWPALLFMILIIIVALIILKFIWAKGLRAYDSASS